MTTFTAFLGSRCLATGDLATVASAVDAEHAPQGTIVVLNDHTGREIDLDLREGPARAAEMHLAQVTPAPDAPRQGRGRPRLGVVAREVTLLPRHWDWLASQPGGASAALRRLIDAARATGGEADRARAALDATYRAMSVLAGDRPGFEEAARALFAGDDTRFGDILQAWPTEIAAYIRRLAKPSAPSA